MSLPLFFLLLGDTYQINLGPIDKVVGVGDSIGTGQNATTPSTQGFYPLFKNANASLLTLTNASISARGVLTMVNEVNNGAAATYNRATTVFVTGGVGTNDLRAGGNGPKTMKKLEAGYKYFFLKNNGAVAKGRDQTKVGTWANYNAAPNAGLPNYATLNSTINATLTYTFTGVGGAVAILGCDGVSVGATWGSAEIYLDGVLQYTFVPQGWFDNINDGGFTCDSGPVPIIFMGLSNSLHTIQVKALGASGTIVDSFWTLDHTGNVSIFQHIPYLNATGYATGAAMSSDAVVDQANALISSLAGMFSSYKYFVAVAQVNSFYDVTTGISADGIHPNTVGHAQIAAALQSVIQT